jgi:hypothetical protein
MSRKVVYCPPDDATVDRFAREVCERFAAQQSDPAINSGDTVRGFSSFLKLLMRLEANRLNQDV